jgi:serine/threonine-protein kinase
LIGRSLSHYEILAKLGAGGMGEVYRAVDSRLDREVAIKVLSADLENRSALRARLEREAKAISSLSHPHICTLYDVGEQGGSFYLVMELLAGETLAERLRRGPLAVEEALRVGSQVAEALAAAHRTGLIHRDLKPANIMLTADGAKLLDFGLAKAVAAELAVQDLTALPTLDSPLTVEGTVVGTFQYMAPEQIEGGETDARTDLFGFGAVLYEMLSGKRAFPATSQPGLLAAILKEDPQPLGKVLAGSSPALERLVSKCLAKTPDERWQSAADLADELRWIASQTDQKAAGEQPATGVRSTSRARWGRAALAAGLIFLAGWWIAGQSRSTVEPAAPAVARVSIPLPEDAPFVPVQRSALAISPNGKEIIYVGGSRDSKRLYRRSLDAEKILPIEDTENAESPFFSHAGDRIGFIVQRLMKAVSLTGGAAQRIGIIPPVSRGVLWLRDESIVANPSKAGSLIQLHAGTPWVFTQLTEVDPDLGSGHSWPDLFAGGTKALVTIIGSEDKSYDEASVVAIDLASGEQRVVVEGATHGRYLPTGHLIFLRRGSIFAAPFDTDTMGLSASPVRVLSGVLSDPSSGVGHFAVSPTGTLVYAAGGSLSTQARRPVWVGRSGREQPIDIEPRAIFNPRVSPDGSLIAMSIEAASDDIWVLETERPAFRRLTFGGRNMTPIWTPDGERVTYSSVRGYPEIYTVAVDGSGEEELLARVDEAGLWPGSWSPDGKILAITQVGERGIGIYLVRPGEAPVPFLETEFNESSPAISPDGAWVAYNSDESGRWEVYVTSYPEPGLKLQVSTGGGTQPIWGTEAGELLYRAGSRLVVASIRTAPRLSSGPAEVVYENRGLVLHSSVPGHPPFFDVARDGKRILVVTGRPTPRIDRLELILGWFDELRRLVPIPPG